jgi:hypothetical protein
MLALANIERRRESRCHEPPEHGMRPPRQTIDELIASGCAGINPVGVHASVDKIQVWVKRALADLELDRLSAPTQGPC